VITTSARHIESYKCTGCGHEYVITVPMLMTLTELGLLVAWRGVRIAHVARCWGVRYERD